MHEYIDRARHFGNHYSSRAIDIHVEQDRRAGYRFDYKQRFFSVYANLPPRLLRNRLWRLLPIWRQCMQDTPRLDSISSVRVIVLRVAAGHLRGN